MDQNDEVFGNYNIVATISEEEMELKRGPWTLEEDFTLIDYVNRNGEGRWNSLARSAGLNRTGKSCRLRWLNYLRPDLRRGNITLEEQLLILELHCRWGNRWSKIAQHLPGRTDNEIKNYWRTRVQKHAKQLKCDVNSKQFKDTMRHVWIPRLVEKIQASASSRRDESSGAIPVATSNTNSTATNYQNITNIDMISGQIMPPQHNVGCGPHDHTSDSSSGSFGTSASEVTDCLNNYTFNSGSNIQVNHAVPDNFCYGQQLSPISDFNDGLNFTEMNGPWMNGGDFPGTFWDVDDMWFLHE